MQRHESAPAVQPMKRFDSVSEQEVDSRQFSFVIFHRPLTRSEFHLEEVRESSRSRELKLD